MKYKTAYLVLVSLSFVLLCGTMFGVYKIVNKAWLLTTLEKKEGTVISCKSDYFKRTINANSGAQQLKYTPVVRIDNGMEVAGLVYSSHESCNELVRETVAVLIDPSAENGGFIVTFSQYWLGPLTLIIGTLLANLVFVYPMARVTKKL